MIKNKKLPKLQTITKNILCPKPLDKKEKKRNKKNINELDPEKYFIVYFDKL